MTRQQMRLTRLACMASGILLLQTLPVGAQQTNHEVMYFAPEGKPPRGLGDLQAFGLFRDTAAGGTPRYSGWVMANRDDPDHSTTSMRTVRVSGRALTFTAATRAGTVLTFDGRFLRRGDFRPLFNKSVPVVEGIVRKYRHGAKVASARMRFTCGSGG